MSVELAHQEQGPPDAPAVLLAPSLGTTMAMWDGLAGSLADRFRVVRFDTRGHGASPVPDGPYTLSELAEDVLALADRLGIGRFGFAGLSLGGALALTLGLEHPGRLQSLVVCCAGPSFGTPQDWRDRAARVRAEGMEFLAEPTRGRWFTDAFRAAHPDRVEWLVGMLLGTPPAGYAACCDALSEYDVADRLAGIRTPTRVVGGAEDPVSGPDTLRDLAAGIEGADLVLLDGASHIANLAAPAQFAAAVREHLERTL